MKSFLFFSVVSFGLLSFSASVQAAEHQYGSCAFACKSIPAEKDVQRWFGQDSSPQLNSRRIRMLVWNLYKGRMDEFTPTFAKLAADKDVVMISEATTDAPISTAMTAVRGFGWNFATAFLMKKEVGTGTAVGSYATPLSRKFYRTIDVEPFVKSPKTIAAAEYAIPGSTDTLLALSIHGINWSGDDAIVRQVEMTIPDLKAHQGPIVFAGDFNFKNKERLKRVTELLATVGITRVKWENPAKGDQLDDAFTRGVTVHSARLINDYVDKASDHPAIDLDLEY